MCQEAKQWSLLPVCTEASRVGIRRPPNPPAQAGTPRTGLHRAMCSQVLGISKDRDYTIDLDKPFQCLTIPKVKNTFFLHLNSISHISVCAHSVPGHLWKNPSFLMPPMRCLCTVLRVPWAFSSPGWAGSALLASLCMSDVSGPSLSSWPFFGPSPVRPCIVLGSPELDPALQMCLVIVNASSQTGLQRSKTISVVWRCSWDVTQELPGPKTSSASLIRNDFKLLVELFVFLS